MIKILTPPPFSKNPGSTPDECMTIHVNDGIKKYVGAKNYTDSYDDVFVPY
jgi:hypothetical protein